VQRLTGKGMSPGVAMGKALLVARPNAPEQIKTSLHPDEEAGRLQSALNVAKADLSRIKEKSATRLGRERAAILDVQVLMLEDPELIANSLANIRIKHFSAEFAFTAAIQPYLQQFSTIPDPYIRERKSDVEDILKRVLCNLSGTKMVDLSSLAEPSILITEDISVAEMASIDAENVLGIVIEKGGIRTHAAIIARALGIPAVCHIPTICRLGKDAKIVVLDGSTGDVIFDPDPSELTTYQDILAVERATKLKLSVYRNVPAITKDDAMIKVECNVAVLDDLPNVVNQGADGIGLLRTELLFLGRVRPPSEDEQFEFYKAFISKLAPKPVTIRTIDVGGDKGLPYLNIEQEKNPFLGVRGIRLCLRNTVIFRTQLRALLRASCFGNCRIMLPMVTSLEEVLSAKQIVEDVTNNLREEKKIGVGAVPLGIMIEVPSAALLSDILAKHVDFFSIGTNDLAQYTLAVDRTNSELSNLYDPLHPAVLRLIKMVINNANQHHIDVGLCGELGGDPEAIPLLIGLGLSQLSMNPSAILSAKKILRETHCLRAKELAQKALNLGQASAVRFLLQEVHSI
jgi:phosphotransferase system enzyme I (PtsI)